MILVITVLFSLFYLFQINKMTYALCESREIPEEKQPKIYRTVNILITILILSFFRRNSIINDKEKSIIPFLGKWTFFIVDALIANALAFVF